MLWVDGITRSRQFPGPVAVGAGLLADDNALGAAGAGGDGMAVGGGFVLEGFAETGVAVEDGDLAEGEAAGESQCTGSGAISLRRTMLPPGNIAASSTGGAAPMAVRISSATRADLGYGPLVSAGGDVLARPAPAGAV
jgi:hypothetical protein